MAMQQAIFNVANSVYTFEEHKENKRRFYAGEFTKAADILAIVERIKAAESSLKAELNARTLKQLAPGGTGGRKKVDIVKAIYDRLLETFLISDSFTWSPFSETKEAALSRAYAALTDEKLIAFNEKIRARRADLEKALSHPETLEEFRRFVEHKGGAALSSEQKARMDELQAEQCREQKARELARRAEVQAVTLEGVTMSMVESVHTKKHVPLWVVQLDQRVERDVYSELNGKAKVLGGWYSSFNKACTGFHFWEKEQAEKFMALQSGNVSRLDHVLEKQEEVKDRAAARLRELAEDMKIKAHAELDRERLANTARRAGMAEHAEASARESIRVAETMENLSDAIESGAARHLEGVKHRSHVETLDLLVKRARNKAGRLAGESGEKTRERAPVAADIEHVEYPYPTIWKNHIEDACAFLANKPGALRLVQKIKKRLASEKSDLVRFRWESEIRDLAMLVSKMQENGASKWDYERLKDALMDYNRVKAMGLDTEPELRAALREYLQYRTAGHAVDPIKKMERALIGQKIPGYFPTPGAVVDRLLELADIQPGMVVLEPSAGKGNIADGIRSAVPGAIVQVVECSHSLQEILKAKGYPITAYNFLDIEAGSWFWDRVVMNPPFENGQDIDHVRHAFDCLKPGGRLVAVMSEGPFFRSERQAADFRAWLEEVGGWSERLPEGSFKNAERSTGVNTRIVVIERSA